MDKETAEQETIIDSIMVAITLISSAASLLMMYLYAAN